MKDKSLHILTEEQFDDLFNQLIYLVIKRGDQKERDLISYISDVYEVREFIPEILLYEKQIKERVFIFKYDYAPNMNSRSNIDGFHNLTDDLTLNIDLPYTLQSIKTFFKLYLSDDKYGTIIDDAICKEIISSTNKVLEYIQG